MSVKERLIEYIKYKSISKSAFCRTIGVSNAFVSSMRTSIQPDKIESIALNFPDLDTGWLLTGEGKMLKSQSESEIIRESKLIPFYDDVVSMGGTQDIAEPGSVNQPAEYVDAGDWFKDATAAIRHYGESMTEYPNGCIIAIKEVQDRSLIVFGKDYVIETSEYRITKRLQSGSNNDCITAYSSNGETYPDGRQIHEPFIIQFTSIRRLFLVLGYVVKKNGGTMIFSNTIK